MNASIFDLMRAVMSIDMNTITGEQMMQILTLQMRLAELEEAQLTYALELSMREANPKPEPPKKVNMKEHTVSATECQSCTICLCDFEYREKGVIELKCGHVFHRDCASKWFEAHHTCPTCRTNIDEG